MARNSKRKRRDGLEQGKKDESHNNSDKDQAELQKKAGISSYRWIYEVQDIGRLQEFPVRVRDPVIKIILVEDLICALHKEGICLVASRQTKKRICILNDEFNYRDLIYDVYYNKKDDCMLTVRFIRSQDDRIITKTTIESIRRGKPDEGSTRVFKESLKISYVNFDIPNSRAIVYSVIDRNFKIFDLENYKIQYILPDETFHFSDFSLQSSGNTEMIMYMDRKHQKQKTLPLRIYSKTDGKRLTDRLNCPLHSKQMIKSVTLCGKTILLKQERRGIEIVDVFSSDSPIIINKTKINENITIIPPLFLPKSQRFLAYHYLSYLALWTLEGDLALKLDQHAVTPEREFWKKTYITQDEDVIISYCALDFIDNIPLVEHIGNKYALGNIRITSLVSGHHLGLITTALAEPDKKREWEGALSGVTTLTYDETTNEIFTGNADGHVYIWSPYNS